MWHEARKQERRIRGMIVDYRKRAERRQDFYEKIQADPTQFIQVHGRRCKIHLDPAVAAAGDGAAIIVPWQGQQDNLIDRFDVRAHLDQIPLVAKSDESESVELPLEERQCNYERYRILAQNDFVNVPEEKFLHQLYLEEQYGANAQLEAERNLSKKRQQKPGATIGYSYDDTESSSIGPQPFSHLMHVGVPAGGGGGSGKSDKGSDSDSDSDMDMDVSIDISKLDNTQGHELNTCGRNYGMVSNDFYSYLTKDADEADALRIAREEEQEKMLLSGRKSRRERRAQKERRIACRPFSPPSYAAKEDAGKKSKHEEESDSRSPSPSDANAGKITYITSFGGEDELQPHSKISINIGKGTHTLGEACAGATAAAASGQVTYAQKVKENLEKLKQLNETSKRTRRSRSRSRSRSGGSRRGGGRDRRRRSYLRSRSRSRSYDRRRKDRRSRSSSYRSRRQRRHKRSRSHSGRHHYSSSSSSASTRSSRSNSFSRHSRRKRAHDSPKHKKSPPYTRRMRSSSASKNSAPKRSRSRSPPAPSTTSVYCEKKTTDAKNRPADVQTAAVIAAAPSAPPMISYPLPVRIMGSTTTSSSITPAIAAATPMTVAPTSQVVEAPPPPLKRYYGRKRGGGADGDDSSSNSVSDTDDADDKAPTKGDGHDTDTDRMDVDTTSERSNPLPAMSATSSKQTGKYSTVQAKNPSFSNASETKGSSGSSRLNLRERLKRKMQNLLNKQYKADKRAEIEKTERERLLQQEREDEMRELALKLRRRQRELRHRYGTPSTGKGSDSEASEPAKSHKSKRSKSHSSVESVAVEKHSQLSRSSREREEYQRRARPAGRDSRDQSKSKRTRTRSRSQSFYRVQQRRSRSRSRSRRSSSRRRRRSTSRRQRRSPSRTRITERSRRGDDDRERYRRSKSRNERSAYRDRERQREADRIRDRERDRVRDRERVRDSDRERYPRGYRDTTPERGSTSSRPSAASASTSFDVAGGSSNRNRIVISAPPKLKKLVDY